MKEPYQQLETEWAAWNDLSPEGMVVCASGTAALHLAFESLQLPPDSETICPDFAMIACPRAISMAGLRPVFVDCGDDLNLDPVLGNQAVGEGRNVRAVLLVHTYGRCCQTWWLDGHEFAEPSCRVVEDLAEAHGVRPHPDTDAACWSFFKNKVIAGEEGGAVWFRDPEHAALARQQRCLGFTPAHDFWHTPRGHNYRLSNLHANAILHGLRMQGERMVTRHMPNGLTPPEQRRIMEGWYDDACPPAWRMPPRDVPWVFDFRIPGLSHERQNAMVAALRSKGIAARHGFKPCHLQPEYLGKARLVAGDVHRAAVASRETLYLPIQPGITTPASVRLAFDTLLSL